MFVALGGYLHGRERYPCYGPDPYTHTGPWVPMVMCFGRLLPMTHLPYRLGHGNAPKTEKLPK